MADRLAIWVATSVGLLQLAATVFYLGKCVGELQSLRRELADLSKRVTRLETVIMREGARA